MISWSLYYSLVFYPSINSNDYDYFKTILNGSIDPETIELIRVSGELSCSKVLASHIKLHKQILLI